MGRVKYVTMNYDCKYMKLFVAFKFISPARSFALELRDVIPDRFLFLLFKTIFNYIFAA